MAKYLDETGLGIVWTKVKGELGKKQDTLVSGTNIKTVNGASLLGEGNIVIETPEGGISDAPQDGKMYGRKDAAWSEVVLPDVSDMLTKTEAAGTYQPKGDYVTNEALNGKGYQTSSDVEAKIAAVVDSAPETLDTLNELAAALGDDPNFATTISTQIGQKVDTATYTADKATFALKTELPDVSDMLTKTEAAEDYQAKGDYALKSEVPTRYVKSFTGTDNGFRITQTGDSDTLGGLTFGEGFTVVNTRNTPSVSIDTETIATKEDLAGKLNTTDVVALTEEEINGILV